MKRNTLVVLALATVLFAIPALSQIQPNTLFIDLRTGTWMALNGLPPGVPAPQIRPATNSKCSGWFEAFVDINLQPLKDGKARAAYITTEYEGTPYQWTVDIGDSPSDNGYGGGSDSKKAAEVQVVDQTLTVYDDNTQVYGKVDNLLTQELELTNGSLKFAIADQILAVGQPRTILATPITKLLYILPDTNEANCPYCIHAGFNHVVDKATKRSGCGARSVAIWTGTGGV